MEASPHRVWTQRGPCPGLVRSRPLLGPHPRSPLANLFAFGASEATVERNMNFYPQNRKSFEIADRSLTGPQDHFVSPSLSLWGMCAWKVSQNGCPWRTPVHPPDTRGPPIHPADPRGSPIHPTDTQRSSPEFAQEQGPPSILPTALHSPQQRVLMSAGVADPSA